jgi:uncharacterized membrane protein YsdA (DUF1294 family)
MEKQRHGCVTAWLILMIVINSLTSVIYLFFGDRVREEAPEVSESLLMLLAFLTLSNVFFAAMLLRWKKLGFWGFAITSAAAFILNLMMGMDILRSVLGISGLLILYAILQIKKNDTSTWENLE